MLTNIVLIDMVARRASDEPDYRLIVAALKPKNVK